MAAQPRPRVALPPRKNKSAHLWATLATALVGANVVGAEARCVFDCRDRTKWCGDGSRPAHTLLHNAPVHPANFRNGGFDFDDNAYYGEVEESLQLAEPINALDLRHRRISAIAPGGLSCYAMQSATLPRGVDPSRISQVALLDLAPRLLTTNTNFTQAVLLDNNSLTEWPDFSVFAGDAARSDPPNYGVSFISLQGNHFTTVPTRAMSGWAGEILVVYLEDSGITTIEPEAFFTQPYPIGFIGVFMDNNSISHLGNGSLATPAGNLIMSLSLSYNRVSALTEDTFFGCTARNLYLFLENNLVSSIVPECFAGYTGSYFNLYLSYNLLSSLPQNMFGGLSSSIAGAFMQGNSIAALPDNFLGGFTGGELFISAVDNRLQTMGAICAGYAGSGAVTLSLQHNSITVGSLAAALGSFESSLAELTIELEHNHLTGLPAFLFESVGSRLSIGGGFGATVYLALGNNAITHVSLDVFASSQAETGAQISLVALDISDNPLTTPFTAGARFNFSNTQFGRRQSLSVLAASTGLGLSLVNALSGFPGVNLSVSLANNSIGSVPAGAFTAPDIRDRLTSLDLSHNLLTSLDEAAFDYTFALVELNLAGNRLTVLPSGVTDILPALQRLNVGGNPIMAIPATSNHLDPARVPGSTAGNVISCNVYGPNLLNTTCTCPAGMTLSFYCNYMRCLPSAEPGGCPSDFYEIENDCTLAPFSVCLNASVMRALDRYAAPIGSSHLLLPLTQCSTAFLQPAGRGHLPAYEFSPPTSTSDRLCSICSTCPAGYTATPCTSTENTRCSREFHLNAGDYAAIVMSAFIVALLAGLGWLWGKSQMKRSRMTQKDLEMTEMLLGDVTMEKDRINEERELMSRAWVIDQSDLENGDVLGVGGMGVVRKAHWGHIPVAVKVLKLPLDFDPLADEDFQREVSFMRSIRHPHCMLFYGCGVNDDHQAFIVTELMARGSLRNLLADAGTQLDWARRLTFARDIASGVNYLHSQGAAHRDLKADNCMVDENWRVKVGDFGTGRLQVTTNPSAARPSASSPVPVSGGGRTGSGTSSVRSSGSRSGRRLLSSSSSTSETSLTATGSSRVSDSLAPSQLGSVTTNIGSLIWMAPEVLLGHRIDPEELTATDVWSYACVMFEIWTRVLPWWHVEAKDHFELEAKIKQAVLRGDRPVPPDGCDAPPAGYEAVMTSCWAFAPTDRPTFADVLARLPTSTPSRSA